MTAASGDQAAARLTSLIARQRNELDAVRSRAAARAVVDLARGMLMERLGCGPAEAQRQLAHLAAEAGTTVAELAAEVTSQHPVAAAEPDGGLASLAGAAIELAADGAGMAAALLDQALGPAGAIAVALWLIDADGGLQLAGQVAFGAGGGQPVAATAAGDELADPAGGQGRRRPVVARRAPGRG